MNHRSLQVIAREIRVDWVAQGKQFPAARPYWQAMGYLTSINDNYHLDSGRDIVLRFLANASSWRGETARRIKTELRRIKAELKRIAAAA